MSIYAYIAAMALTTYLIRMLPMTIFRKPIRSRFLRSFLYYVPYACLTAMTFPSILSSAGSLAAGISALAVGSILPGKEPGGGGPEHQRRCIRRQSDCFHSIKT